MDATEEVRSGLLIGQGDSLRWDVIETRFALLWGQGTENVISTFFRYVAKRAGSGV